MAFEVFEVIKTLGEDVFNNFFHTLLHAENEMHDLSPDAHNSAVEALVQRPVIIDLMDIFDTSRVPNPNEYEYPADDALDGPPSKAYLRELSTVQIPALQADIDRAIAKLDPVRDAKVIMELQDMRDDLESIKTQIGRHLTESAARWGVYAENQPLTGRGAITPESAYKAVIAEIEESRQTILQGYSPNLIA